MYSRGGFLAVGHVPFTRTQVFSTCYKTCLFPQTFCQLCGVVAVCISGFKQGLLKVCCFSELTDQLSMHQHLDTSGEGSHSALRVLFSLFVVHWNSITPKRETLLKCGLNQRTKQATQAAFPGYREEWAWREMQGRPIVILFPLRKKIPPKPTAADKEDLMAK